MMVITEISASDCRRILTVTYVLITWEPDLGSAALWGRADSRIAGIPAPSVSTITWMIATTKKNRPYKVYFFSPSKQSLLCRRKEDCKMVKKDRLINRDVAKDMRELYRKGWSPREICLLYQDRSKLDNVEKFVMRALKPLFS